MNDDASIAAIVVREALENIFELVQQSATSSTESDVDNLRDEVNATILALIAHLITVDGKYDPGERAFLVQLVDFGRTPNAELGYLRECSERWRVLERKVPAFFRIALEADATNKTDAARSIIREIQLIANNCAVTDNHFAAAERRVIERYLRFLEESRERHLGRSERWIEP